VQRLAIGLLLFSGAFGGRALAQYPQALPVVPQGGYAPYPYARPPVAQPSPSVSRPPRKAPSKEELSGHDSFYASAMIGGGFFQESHVNPDPSEPKQIGDAKITANTDGLIGWGPVSWNGFSLLAHYRYAQDWSTDFGQVDRFRSQWFSAPKASTFLFPTKSLVRTHEAAADARFLFPEEVAGISLSVGSQFLLSAGRTGSSFLGEDSESAETIWAMENMAPYVQARIGRALRSQVIFPYRTFINKTDPEQSFATYSWSSTGRGRLYSVLVKNEVPLPAIQSSLFVDFRYYQLKYSSLTLDRNRPGFSFMFDFPVFSRLRASVKGAYDLDVFYLPKVRIASFRRGMSGETTEASKEFDRRDSNYSVGASAYFDLDSEQTHRIFVDFSMTQIVSTIAEFNGEKQFFLAGYRWAFPGAPQLMRRMRRFHEDTYATEF
jgi:hypothetical protein